MDKALLKDYVWVKRGKQRRQIIKALVKDKFPSEIAKETNIKFSNVSDVLRNMTEHEIANVINKQERVGRIYRLTPKGRKVLKELET